MFQQYGNKVAGGNGQHVLLREEGLSVHFYIAGWQFLQSGRSWVCVARSNLITSVETVGIEPSTLLPSFPRGMQRSNRTDCVTHRSCVNKKGIRSLG